MDDGWVYYGVLLDRGYSPQMPANLWKQADKIGD